MIDLDKLERLEKAALPSPWSIDMEPNHGFWQVVYCETNRYHVGDFDDDPSASFIVALRNAAPALFAELRRWRAIDQIAAQKYDGRSKRSKDCLKRLQAAAAERKAARAAKRKAAKEASA